MSEVKIEHKGQFCVWTKTGHFPRVYYVQESFAEAEATRLALANPGKKFIVLQMRNKFSAKVDA